MNQVILLLFAFVALGLVSHRLRGYSYVALSLVVLVYVLYAYIAG